MILNEEKIIHKQLIKNMLYNFIIFTVIFSLFGIIIFNTVKSFVYESSKTELEKAVNTLYNQKENNMQLTSSIKANENYTFMQKAEYVDAVEINPRITYILRDEFGNILNGDTVGRIYEEFIKSTSFDKNKINEIYDLNINNKYTYRGINVKAINQDGETMYVQLLVNIDAEKAIIDNYFTILITGIIITIILSIIASYIISKKSLEPIIKSWKKQTEFVQNASHELRTPLTIIQTKQELLLQEPKSTIIDKSEDITLTLNEAKRLSKLTKDLMVLARADSNDIELQKEEIEIDELIKNILLPYMDFAKMEEKEIFMKLNYNDKVDVDTNKIHQLIVIILDNAIKYTKNKDVIEVNTYKKDNKCVIEIKDEGMGISEEGLKHVFDRFYREDKARSRKTGGSGLGLSIAKYIVEAHKGSIKISNNNPKGTIVTVKLPKI